MITKIDEEKWIPITISANSRKVQHYGFLYDYMTGKPGDKTDPLPAFLEEMRDFIVEKCIEIGLLTDTVRDRSHFNSCIINDYQVGQGISPHTDNKLFGKIIGCFTLSHGEFPGEMEFTREGYKKVAIHPKPNSLYIMSGECRKKWKHALIGRKSDPPLGFGKRTKRERRISVTFRRVPEMM